MNIAFDEKIKKAELIIGDLMNELHSYGFNDYFDHHELSRTYEDQIEELDLPEEHKSKYLMKIDLAIEDHLMST